MQTIITIIAIILACALEIAVIYYAIEAYKRQKQIFDYQKLILRHITDTENEIRKLKKRFEELQSTSNKIES